MNTKTMFQKKPVPLSTTCQWIVFDPSCRACGQAVTHFEPGTGVSYCESHTNQAWIKMGMKMSKVEV
jgi:hypothetical protein